MSSSSTPGSPPIRPSWKGATSTSGVLPSILTSPAPISVREQPSRIYEPAVRARSSRSDRGWDIMASPLPSCMLSKAGLWMLTRVLAQELAGDNISVNELIPGPVQTSLSTLDPQHSVAAVHASEWRKLPEDVVPLALFLATQPDRGPTAQSFSLMRRDT